MAVENTGHRSGYGLHIIEWFLDHYPPEFVGWCFDSGHANLAGNAARLYAFGDRLIALHLHDNLGEKDDHQPPFFGTVDWKATLGFIRGSGYTKPINFEITHRTEHFAGTMLQYLRYARERVTGAMRLFSPPRRRGSKGGGSARGGIRTPRGIVRSVSDPTTSNVPP